MKKRSERPAEHAKILLAIEERFGIVTPKMVVDLARDPNHPLHAHFEWRNDIAAQKFREEQARELIRNARLNVIVHEVPLEAIAFVHDPTLASQQQGYRSTTSLRGDQNAALESLAIELRQAAALLRRSRDIAVSLALDAAPIETLQASVEGLAAALVSTVTDAAKVA